MDRLTQEYEYCKKENPDMRVKVEWLIHAGHRVWRVVAVNSDQTKVHTCSTLFVPMGMTTQQALATMARYKES